MSDRDELVDALGDEGSIDYHRAGFAADAILAKWWLVPVGAVTSPSWFCADCQEFQPQSHEHWPHGLDDT